MWWEWGRILGPITATEGAELPNMMREWYKYWLEDFILGIKHLSYNFNYNYNQLQLWDFSAFRDPPRTLPLPVSPSCPGLLPSPRLKSFSLNPSLFSSPSELVDDDETGETVGDSLEEGSLGVLMGEEEEVATEVVVPVEEEEEEMAVAEGEEGVNWQIIDWLTVNWLAWHWFVCFDSVFFFFLYNWVLSIEY